MKDFKPDVVKTDTKWFIRRILADLSSTVKNAALRRLKHKSDLLLAQIVC